MWSRSLHKGGSRYWSLMALDDGKEMQDTQELSARCVPSCFLKSPAYSVLIFSACSIPPLTTHH